MTERMKVLVVDDEPQIHRFLKPALTAAGYDFAGAENGAEAVRQIATAAPDVVVLDLGLPDMDGKDVIRDVRAWSQVPIVVLSVRNRETEKIEALDLGADDYVEKPFSIGELTARLRTTMRRHAREAGETTAFVSQGLMVDTLKREVRRDGSPIKLTPKEYDLLATMVRHAGRVLTHRHLLSAVWGPAHTEDTQYLRVFVGQLRQKIEADPTHPKLIVTEPGVGYRLLPQDG